MSDTSWVDEIGVMIGRTKGFLLSDRTAHEVVDAVVDVVRDVIARGMLMERHDLDRDEAREAP
ncbi:hypothetical protein [Arthrobacter sp. NPDC092385]|uniref:hypothetical protein n=1 Tax=Arthrobacter sp. NPDC092385 TaxID=3363943 RepID=UPI00380859EB